MTNIRAIIADDERLARKGLMLRLSKYPDVDIIGESSNGINVLKTIKQLNPNVVFLDIEMPGINGAEVARTLSENPQPPIIVFVTAYPKYAAGAFEIPVLDYLLKPVSENRIEHCLDRIRTALAVIEKSNQETTISVKEGNKKIIIRAGDILYIEAAGDFAIIYTSEQSYIHNATLKSLALQLEESGIVRTHRSLLVAKHQIENILSNKHGDGNLTLRNGVSLKFSRSYKQNIH